MQKDLFIIVKQIILFRFWTTDRQKRQTGKNYRQKDRQTQQKLEKTDGKKYRRDRHTDKKTDMQTEKKDRHTDR